MEITKEIFDDFEVYSCEQMKNFCHISITNPSNLYLNLFEYFFDEKKLLRYIENKANVPLSPSDKDYAALFNKLGVFIDSHNDVSIDCNTDEEILRILKDEYLFDDRNHTIRLDKIGKIGEYIFSNLLFDYFKFECVIPKLNMITDRNMNIFGIDTLFYSLEEKMLMFGESKVSKSLENGIQLLKTSLKEYENQIDEEYRLVLSNRWLNDKMGTFSKDFGEELDICVSMKMFIEKAHIESIGVPLFVAYGGEYDINDIFEQLSKIDLTDLFGINTKVFVISLPIINKENFSRELTHFIAFRRAEYERKLS